jgi:predicted RNA-binding protein YlxR (DUF448 family)
VPRGPQVERTCALTREVRPAADLIRFVLGPDGAIWPDVDEKAEGRGVWITLSEDAVREAQKKAVFARSLKATVTMPHDLAALTREHLTQRLLGALGMAKKAGQIVTGKTRVEGALKSGETIALFTAADAGEDGRTRMLALAKALGIAANIPHLEVLECRQLGLALGTENVIHAALTKGAAAHSALARAQRLARFIAPKDLTRGAVSPDTAGAAVSAN